MKSAEVIRPLRLSIGAVALALVLLSAPVALADPAGKTTIDETIRAASGSGYVALQSGPGESYRGAQAPVREADRRARASSAGRSRSSGS